MIDSVTNHFQMALRDRNNCFGHEEPPNCFDYPPHLEIVGLAVDLMIGEVRLI